MELTIVACCRCGWQAESGLDTLCDLNLVTIDFNVRASLRYARVHAQHACITGARRTWMRHAAYSTATRARSVQDRLRMHDQLRDMGRALEHSGMTGQPMPGASRQRIWEVRSLHTSDQHCARCCIICVACHIGQVRLCVMHLSVTARAGACHVCPPTIIRS